MTFPGTYRIRSPQQTLLMIRPVLGDFGITRLADVTGLDVIGIPVIMATRPLAATLSVSQGKGVTLDLARVSAAMEAIEIWHAEHAVPAPAIRSVAAWELRPGYDVRDLDRWPGSLLTEDTPLDWIMGRAAVSGQAVPVPRAGVHLDARPRARAPLPAVLLDQRARLRKQPFRGGSSRVLRADRTRCHHRAVMEQRPPDLKEGPAIRGQLTGHLAQQPAYKLKGGQQ